VTGVWGVVCDWTGRRETQRDAILRTACEKYAAIVDDGGATHAVHYNWGVALR
jgi:hypothetical protein